MSEAGKRNQDRLQALKKLLADDPRSLAFVTLAEEHNRLGQHDDAASVAQRGLLSHPDSVAGRLALAVAEAERDNVREALEQIKRALIIDQENPRALALMGRILLKRGLAKRAVQFLSHAVKLDPKEPEYGHMLADARRMAKGDDSGSGGMPVFTGDNVPSVESPWSGDDESVDQTVSPEAEHTVFDPDALKKLKKDKAGGEEELDDALKSLPGVGGGLDADAEPTAYYDRNGEQRSKDDLPPPRRVDGAPPDPREEPTDFGAKNPLREKPKMGGSAAEYSQMMKKADADAVRAVAEQRVRDNPPPANAATDDLEISSPQGTSSHRPKASEPKPTPVPPAPGPETESPGIEKTRASGPRPAPPAAKAASAPRAAPSAPAPSAPAPAPKPPPEAPPKKPPAAHKQIGPASTRMVDEALWALFGQKGPAEAPAEPSPSKAEAPPEKPKKAPAASAEGEKKKPVRARVKGKDEPGKPGAPGQMVVRTSERFGAWTRGAIITVLTVAAGFTGYAVALSSAGPGPEVASEELKGIASDLERGGLASLLAAEDHTQNLIRSNPDLEPLLSGALAEIYARRYQAFGRNPEMKTQAEKAISRSSKKKPTVELVTAMVELSTTSTDRKVLHKALDATLKEYPESPKAWVMKSRLALIDGRKHAALEALYRANAIHPQHRLTLLQLARWYADHGAHGTAFNYFDQLQERYPLDVEAAIDRYVLGQMTGEDPSESQAVSTLAGLVREEIPEVAKDEAGRAALAFAIPLFAKGQIAEGIEELGKAEAAFEDSAEFKAAMGGMLIAVGEFERARRQFSRALELEPDVEAHRVGLARCTYGERLDVKLDLAAESKKVQKAFEKRGKKGASFAELPYATARLRFGVFHLVEVAFDPMHFPDGEYAAATKKADGGALQKMLEAASIVAVGERRIEAGKNAEATAMFEEALSLHPLPSAHFGLGRAHLEKNEMATAIRHLDKGLAGAPDDIGGRLNLARAHLTQKAPIDAIEVLEKFEGSDVVVPEAMYMLGRLRARRGDYEGALSPLVSLTTLRPKDADARIALGEVYAKLGRRDDAVDSFEEAVKAEPKITTGGRVDELSPAAMAYLGRVELDRKPRRGVKLLKKALEYEEAPIEAHFFLGRALLASRRTRRQGKRELETFIRMGPSGDMRDEAERLLRRR